MQPYGARHAHPLVYRHRPEEISGSSTSSVLGAGSHHSHTSSYAQDPQWLTKIPTSQSHISGDEEDDLEDEEDLEAELEDDEDEDLDEDEDDDEEGSAAEQGYYPQAVPHHGRYRSRSRISQDSRRQAPAPEPPLFAGAAPPRHRSRSRPVTNTPLVPDPALLHRRKHRPFDIPPAGTLPQHGFDHDRPTRGPAMPPSAAQFPQLGHQRQWPGMGPPGDMRGPANPNLARYPSHPQQPPHHQQQAPQQQQLHHPDARQQPHLSMPGHMQQQPRPSPQANGLPQHQQQQLVQVSPYDHMMYPPQPQQSHQQQQHMTSPMAMMAPGGGYFPQQMMSYGYYPYGGAPVRQSSSPDPEASTTKLLQEHIKNMEELMKAQQAAAIARDKQREAEAEEARKVAAAKAAKEAEERKRAEEMAAAAKKAREEAEAEAAKKAKAAADASEKAIKEAADASEKAIKEATAKVEAAEKAKKAAEEEAKKFKPSDDSTKQPIKFIDAVGRKFVLPWKMVKTWEGMQTLIHEAFHGVDKLEMHVKKSHYDLIGPNGEIILPQVWESTVQPDWVVKMQMWQVAEEKKEEPKPAPPPAPGPAPVIARPARNNNSVFVSRKKKARPTSAVIAEPVAAAPQVQIISEGGPAPRSDSKSRRRGSTMLAFFAGGSSGGAAAPARRRR